MRIYLIFILLLILSCTDLFDTELNLDSVQLDGGSWIQIVNRDDFTDDKDLNVLEGSFTLEFFVSGGKVNTTDSPVLFMVGNDDGGIELGFFLDQNQPNIIRIIWKEEISEINLEDLYGGFDFESLNLNWENSDQYYYITIVYNAVKSNLEILLNRQYLKDISNCQLPIINENDLFIGAKGLKELNEEPANFWIGSFDEVRIWNTTLNDYYYFDEFVQSYTDSIGNNPIEIIDNEGISYECEIGTDWDSTNTYFQVLEDFRESNYYHYTDGGCYCNENEDDSFDCWTITSVIDYHYNHPDQVIANYGDPLIDSLICLLRFNEYPDDGKTVKDESGNQNHGKIYSLPGFEAEFIEDGF